MIRERITSTSNVLKDRRHKSFIKIVWFFFAFVIFLIGLALLSHIDRFLITNISVSGNKILEEEDITKQTFEILSEKVLFVFAGENKFLFSKKNLIKELKATFPRILDIDVVREQQKILLTISERERAYLWCGEEAPSFEDRFLERDCYFLDNSGFIFDTSPRFSSGVYFTFYSKIEGDNPIGQYVLDFQFLKDINSLTTVMEEHNLPVHSLVIQEAGQYELFLNIATTLVHYPRLLFTSEQSIEEIYNKFVSFIDEEPFVTDFLEKSNRLEYIDLRFKNRVFYRFAP